MTSFPRPRGERRHRLEPLESRRLLSAAIDFVATPEPDLRFEPHASSSVAGYSPAQIRHAYGFDQISFGNGIVANGAGQTIAIVDAYHNPKIQSDLKIFNAKFGLPDPPSFTVVSQTGGSPDGIPVDSGWAAESALDVEWAHAIAPGASLLLVEANSDSYADLMVAVDFARKFPGVSVVSTSWGGDEFSRQTRYDATFTTPKSHNGVTFVASAGDDGGLYGAQWPATSPNVLSVGGTVLTTTDAAGTFGNEIAWNYSTGGASLVEKKPSFQTNAHRGRRRTAPDVAYNASVVHGFSVYCSVPDGGTVGWSSVGGTSAGAPQWAALVAIANQGRALQGKAPLDGPSTTLPTLYSTYAAPGTAGYSTYAATFRDTVGGRVVGATAAIAGYDTATGLGSPRAPAVVDALIKATPAAATNATTTPTTRKRRRGVRPHVQRPGGGDAPPPGQPNPPAVVVDADAIAVTRPGDRLVATVANRNDVIETAIPETTPAPKATPFSAITLAAAAASRANTVYYYVSPPPTDPIPSIGPDAVAAAVAEKVEPPAPVVLNVVAPADVVAPAPVIAAGSPAPIFDFSYPQAAITFGDALANFVHDSTALGSVAIPATGKSRAWTITGTVLALDAIMIGSWYARRRQAKRQKAYAIVRRTPFLFTHVNDR